MSPDVMDWVYALPDLCAGEQSVLLNAVHRGNGKRLMWPSQTRQAADLKMTRQTVCKHMQSLVAKGHLIPLIDPAERAAALAAAGVTYPVHTVVYRVNRPLGANEGCQNSLQVGVKNFDTNSTETLSTTVPIEEIPVGTARKARPTQTTLFEKPKRRKARTSVDPDWWPTEAGLEFAKRLGVTDLDATVGQFRDHHAAKGNLMADWPAAWRTWCRNDKRFRPQQRAQQQPKDRPGIVRDARGFIVRNFNIT